MTTIPSEEDLKFFREARLKNRATRHAPMPTTAQQLVDQMIDNIRQAIRSGERRIERRVRFEPHRLTDLPFEPCSTGWNMANSIRWRSKLHDHINELLAAGGVKQSSFQSGVSWIGLDPVPIIGNTWALACDLWLIVPPEYEVDTLRG